MSEQNPQYVPDDTIDLKELLATLQKRKKMIAAVTALITLLAIIYAFFVAKPVYEAKTMIEIGKIEDKPIDDVKNIKQKLIYEYNVNTRGKKIELPRITAVSVPKGSDSLISIVTHGHSNDEAAGYINNVIKQIETQYQEKTDAYIANQKELIALIQKDIADNADTLARMQKETAEYNRRIISLTREDAALAGIYALQIGQMQTQIQDLKKYLAELKAKEQELKLSITPLMMKPTHIVGETELLDSPVKPKKKLIVVVAFITGLMLSVFLAFFLEFLAGLKEEDNVSSIH